MAEKLSERVFALADTLGLVAAEVAALEQQLADAQREREEAVRCAVLEEQHLQRERATALLAENERLNERLAFWEREGQRAAAIKRVNRDAAESLSRIALALNCLPSSFADGYGHVEQRAAALARRVETLEEAVVAWEECCHRPTDDGADCDGCESELTRIADEIASRASAQKAQGEGS